MWIGQSYQHRGHFGDAAATLTAFLADQRYAKAEEIPDARNLLGMSYKMQGKFDQALAVWKEFLAQHPTHPAWSAVQREIVNTEYAKAADRFRRKDYAAARQLWSEFLAKYPLDAALASHAVPARPDELRRGEMGRGAQPMAAAGVQVPQDRGSLPRPVHDRPHAGREARQAGRGAGRIPQAGLGPVRRGGHSAGSRG